MNRLKLEDTILKYCYYFMLGTIVYLVYIGASLVGESLSYVGDLSLPVGTLTVVGTMLMLPVTIYLKHMRVVGFPISDIHMYTISIVSMALGNVFIVFELGYADSTHGILTEPNISICLYLLKVLNVMLCIFTGITIYQCWKIIKR